MTKAPQIKVPNLIVVSDLHAGCHYGLCPPQKHFKIKLDEGGTYHPSKGQRQVWSRWRYFWDKWVPMVTKGEPYIIVVNGDAIDGMHHKNVTHITANEELHKEIAYQILAPEVDKSAGLIFIRGTEVHTGKSGMHEETLAKRLGAIKNYHGNYSSFAQWIRMGKALINVSHHVGTTGTTAYESTAVFKELVEAYNDAGRWDKKPPDVVVRSHRHRCLEVRIPSANTYATTLATAGWQLKTPFVYRIISGRVAEAQIGGHLIRAGDEDYVYTRFCVWGGKREGVITV